MRARYRRRPVLRQIAGPIRVDFACRAPFSTVDRRQLPRRICHFFENAANSKIAKTRLARINRFNLGVLVVDAQKDIFIFYIAVHDAALMQVLQRGAKAPAETNDAFRRVSLVEGSVDISDGGAPSADKFHDEKERARFRIVDDLVEADEVFVPRLLHHRNFTRNRLQLLPLLPLEGARAVDGDSRTRDDLDGSQLELVGGRVDREDNRRLTSAAKVAGDKVLIDHHHAQFGFR